MVYPQVLKEAVAEPAGIISHSLVTWLQESAQSVQPSCLRHRAAGREVHRNGTDGTDGAKGHQTTACERSIASWRVCIQQCYSTYTLQKGHVHTGKDWEERKEGHEAARVGGAHPETSAHSSSSQRARCHQPQAVTRPSGERSQRQQELRVSITCCQAH